MADELHLEEGVVDGHRVSGMFFLPYDPPRLILVVFREGGGVVDFLAIVDPFDPPWPIFNLADSALCVGVAVLVFLEVTGRRIDGTRATKADSAKLKDD